MKIIRSPQTLQKALATFRRKGKALGFVPTMGYLHEGHLSLMRRARKECDAVVVSIFVNPLQFGPKEDFKKYPRNERRDIRLSKSVKADILFIPEARDLYGNDFQTTVAVGPLASPLCGRTRPGHFQGVATVVAKLFNIVRPQAAYFGQKDYQQARVIEQMTKDLSYDIRIRICLIVREADGLAMSSRNVYLDPEERRRSRGIYRALQAAKRSFNAGERDAKRLARALRSALTPCVGAKGIEYAEIRDAVTLERVTQINRKAVAAAAVRIGKTRLIDNIVLEPNL